jgi:hypothetical protein
MKPRPGDFTATVISLNTHLRLSDGEHMFSATVQLLGTMTDVPISRDTYEGFVEAALGGGMQDELDDVPMTPRNPPSVGMSLIDPPSVASTESPAKPAGLSSAIASLKSQLQERAAEEDEDGVPQG